MHRAAGLAEELINDPPCSAFTERERKEGGVRCVEREQAIETEREKGKRERAESRAK